MLIYFLFVLKLIFIREILINNYFSYYKSYLINPGFGHTIGLTLFRYINDSYNDHFYEYIR